MDGGIPSSRSRDVLITPATPFLVDPEERLKFETLIADLSARFINVPADQVGAGIQNAQRCIVEALDLNGVLVSYSSSVLRAHWTDNMNTQTGSITCGKRDVAFNRAAASSGGDDSEFRYRLQC